jgi:hypothetical protein
MTNKTIFSGKLLNTKVVDQVVSIPESTRTQEYEFVC